MKKTLTIMAGLVIGTGLVLAQGGPGIPGGGPGEGTNQLKGQFVDESSGYKNVWGKTGDAPTEAPKAWKNQYSHSFSGSEEAGKQMTQNRFGKPELPSEVQALVKEFQKDRTRLMSQLKTCSDEERQAILKQMEQLRTQLREQVYKLREEAQQQAEQMRTRFRNNRDRILDQGAGNGGTGRDR